MASIRKTTTGSGATAVQVVHYAGRKVVIEKHVGSAHTQKEVAALVVRANEWMMRGTPQESLFAKTSTPSFTQDTAQYVGTTHTFARDTLLLVFDRIGFGLHNDQLLADMALMRIIEPSSKLRAITLLERYFGVKYAERTVYRRLPKFRKQKTTMEKIAVAWAKQGLSGDLALVLYDVTTLYFETFDADTLRVPGFSKDNKSQQPQIVVGLLVTREGFPLGYEVFKGNTFEGHTMLPVLESFASRHSVRTPTVVADAAMISRANVTELNKRGLSYIVGARLGNTSPAVITHVHNSLGQTDRATVRLRTDHGDLIVDFSAKRARKDKHEMDKQIAKAKALVQKGEPGTRAKFVTRKDAEGAYALDDALVAKTKLLLGMKGYYTNIPELTLSNTAIVERYHDLWNVEATFRMAKSDLATRPIFHYKEDAVHAHMVVCFVALVIGKYMEIATGLSLRMIVDLLWSVSEAHIVDTVSGKTFRLRSTIGEDVKKLLEKLGLSY